MTDVIDALRRGIDRIQKQCGEITTLKAENERLRSALEEVLLAYDKHCDPWAVLKEIEYHVDQAIKESPSD